jgi:hypothetical protein
MICWWHQNFSYHNSVHIYTLILISQAAAVGLLLTVRNLILIKLEALPLVGRCMKLHYNLHDKCITHNSIRPGSIFGFWRFLFSPAQLTTYFLSFKLLGLIRTLTDSFSTHCLVLSHYTSVTPNPQHASPVWNAVMTADTNMLEGI